MNEGKKKETNDYTGLIVSIIMAFFVVLIVLYLLRWKQRKNDIAKIGPDTLNS